MAISDSTNSTFRPATSVSSFDWSDFLTNFLSTALVFIFQQSSQAISKLGIYWRTPFHFLSTWLCSAYASVIAISTPILNLTAQFLHLAYKNLQPSCNYLLSISYLSGLASILSKVQTRLVPYIALTLTSSFDMLLRLRMAFSNRILPFFSTLSFSIFHLLGYAVSLTNSMFHLIKSQLFSVLSFIATCISATKTLAFVTISFVMRLSWSCFLLGFQITWAILRSVFGIFPYIGNLSIMVLYIKPLSYIAMIALLVGAGIGVIAGLVILGVQALIPLSSTTTSNQAILDIETAKIKDLEEKEENVNLMRRHTFNRLNQASKLVSGTTNHTQPSKLPIPTSKPQKIELDLSKIRHSVYTLSTGSSPSSRLEFENDNKSYEPSPSNPDMVTSSTTFNSNPTTLTKNTQSKSSVRNIEPQVKRLAETQLENQSLPTCNIVDADRLEIDTQDILTDSSAENNVPSSQSSNESPASPTSTFSGQSDEDGEKSQKEKSQKARKKKDTAKNRDIYEHTESKQIIWKPQFSPLSSEIPAKDLSYPVGTVYFSNSAIASSTPKKSISEPESTAHRSFSNTSDNSSSRKKPKKNRSVVFSVDINEGQLSPHLYEDEDGYFNDRLTNLDLPAEVATTQSTPQSPTCLTPLADTSNTTQESGISATSSGSSSPVHHILLSESSSTTDLTSVHPDAASSELLDDKYDSNGSESNRHHIRLMMRPPNSRHGSEPSSPSSRRSNTSPVATSSSIKRADSNARLVSPRNMSYSNSPINSESASVENLDPVRDALVTAVAGRLVGSVAAQPGMNGTGISTLAPVKRNSSLTNIFGPIAEE